jgi:hypothetical protein
MLMQTLDVSSVTDQVVQASSTILLSIGSDASVKILQIIYVGQGETLWLWAGISRGSKILYETRQNGTVLMYPVVLPTAREPTSMKVDIDLVLIPVNPQPGTADAIIIVSSRKSLARPAWRLRAVWLDQFLLY